MTLLRQHVYNTECTKRSSDLCSSYCTLFSLYWHILYQNDSAEIFRISDRGKMQKVVCDVKQ